MWKQPGHNPITQSSSVFKREDEDESIGNRTAGSDTGLPILLSQASWSTMERFHQVSLTARFIHVFLTRHLGSIADRWILLSSRLRSFFRWVYPSSRIRDISCRNLKWNIDGSARDQTENRSKIAGDGS